jgi:P-type Ca2+ transporter type 2B
LLKIAEDLGRAGLYAAILIVVVLFLRFMIERIQQNSFDEKKHITEMIHFFILAITVVVVAVPQGLPLAVTLSLAYSVKKMLDDKNLVRKLKACEIMGGANNICSDKTGTLTQNLMTLTTWWNDEYQLFDYQKTSIPIRDYFPPEFEELFLHNCALNSSA